MIIRSGGNNKKSLTSSWAAGDELRGSGTYFLDTAMVITRHKNSIRLSCVIHSYRERLESGDPI